MKSIVGGIATLIVVLGMLVVAFGSWGTVDGGNRGVVKRLGAYTGEIKEEGFYWKTPWIERVTEISVRQQKEQVETEGASKDLQTVKTIVALNLSLDPKRCSEVLQRIGPEYLDKVVAPSMQESIKAVIALYTAEELISKREKVREDMARLIASKLNPIGVLCSVESLNIIDFDFSKSFNEAIEAKVTAEQNALAAKNLLAQKEYEAQQAVATARGKAEAMSIESKALSENPQVLQLRALEKWNGILPQVMGGNGAIPFIETRLDKIESTNSVSSK